MRNNLAKDVVLMIESRVKGGFSVDYVRLGQSFGARPAQIPSLYFHLEGKKHYICIQDLNKVRCKEVLT